MWGLSETAAKAEQAEGGGKSVLIWPQSDITLTFCWQVK